MDLFDTIVNPFPLRLAGLRDAVHRALAPLGFRRGDEVVLVVDELVTAAIVHGDGDRPVRVRVESERSGAVLVSAVWTGSGSWGPADVERYFDPTARRVLRAVGSVGAAWATHETCLWARISGAV